MGRGPWGGRWTTRGASEWRRQPRLRLHRGSGHGRSAAEVATYVVETADRRYDLQSMVAFAIEKKTAYIKLDKGEQRLLVTKNERK